MRDSDDTAPRSAPGHESRLCDMIEDRMDEILLRWEQAVRRLHPAADLPQPVLRDHLPQLLNRVAQIVRTTHEGGSASLEEFPDAHALARLDEGFDLTTVAAEFALLRETILELWQSEVKDAILVEEIVRLNRAIDETVGASIARYSAARDRTLKALDRLSAAALGKGDLETFLPKLIEVLQQTTEAVDSVVVLLLEGDDLRVRAAVGLDANARGFALKMGECFAGQIARSRAPALLKVASERRPFGEADALRRNKVQVVYGVPLIHDGEVLGVAHMGSRTAFDFSEADKQLFRAMAQRATSLIAQAQLVSREQVARREAQRALALLDTALSASPVGLGFLDTELRYVRVNPALAAHNGLASEDHVGRSVTEVLGQRGEPLIPVLRRVLSTREPELNYEIVDTTAPTNRSFLASYYPVETAAGELLGVGGVVTEVTELKRIQLEADRRSAELEAILESLPEAVYVGDSSGIKRVNAIALEQLGFTDVEELNQNIATLAERIQTRDAQTGVRLLPEEEPFSHGLAGEYWVREVLVRHLKTGEDCVLRSSSAPVVLEGTVIGAVAINVDITEQKRTEEQLRLKEERLRLAVEAAQAGLFDDDLVTGELRWDARCKALFGRSPDKRMTYELALAAIHPDDRERVLGAIAAAKDPVRRDYYRVDYRTRGIDDGVERWVAASGKAVFDASGRPVRFIGTVVDITERKRAEEELRLTAQFREQFISVLGHDLRNPLAAIRASADMMLKRNELQPGQLKGLSRISTSADRMSRMISDVLDFARGGLGGGFPIAPQRVNLHEVCQRAVDELHVAHPDRELSFEAKGDGWGYWDADRVAQAVSNLVGNALQHGATDAPVSIRLCNKDDGVLLQVANQGEPIPAEMLPVIFEPFRSAVAAPARLERKSLGLGLWIVHEIVASHGGAIDVRSTEAEGTVFSVWWPRQPRATRSR